MTTCVLKAMRSLVLIISLIASLFLLSSCGMSICKCEECHEVKICKAYYFMGDKIMLCNDCRERLRSIGK